MRPGAGGARGWTRRRRRVRSASREGTVLTQGVQSSATSLRTVSAPMNSPRAISALAACAAASSSGVLGSSSAGALESSSSSLAGLPFGLEARSLPMKGRATEVRPPLPRAPVSVAPFGATSQAPTNHKAQSPVAGGLEIFRTARRADASRACWGGVSRASEGRSTVGSGKTISGSADFSVGQILTREHAPHPNPVSLIKAVSPLLGESAVVSGRYGEAKDVTQTVVCLTRQGSESLAGVYTRELRSSRRGSSDPGRS